MSSDGGDMTPETPQVPQAPPSPPAPPTPPVPEVPERRKMLPSGFASLRDLITFTGGMLLIGYEVFVSGEVRAYVLGVGLMMAGLPLVFGTDEKKKGP